MKHILIEKAFSFKKRKTIEEPKDYYYDHLIGAWISSRDGKLLIQSDSFPGLGTKKNDIETGEDNKGQ